MTVLLVVTEHSSRLTPAAIERYEEARRRVADAAGTAVERVHYEDASDLTGAEAVVLSGSHAPWAAHDPAALERLVRRGQGLRRPRARDLRRHAAAGDLRRRLGAHAADLTAAGYRPIEVIDDGDLLAGLPARAQVYQHHTDEIAELPEGFRVLARSEECAIEAIAAPARRWWGTQFHSELASPEHPEGDRVLRNFFELACVRG